MTTIHHDTTTTTTTATNLHNTIKYMKEQFVYGNTGTIPIELLLICSTSVISTVCYYTCLSCIKKMIMMKQSTTSKITHNYQWVQTIQEPRTIIIPCKEEALELSRTLLSQLNSKFNNKCNSLGKSILKIQIMVRLFSRNNNSYP